MKTFSLILIATLLFSCDSSAQKKTDKNPAKSEFKINKTDAEWKSELTAAQYNVLRQGGTERAFSSALNDNHKSGTYICAACKTPLYKSENKFDSGTGWPSFDRVIEGNVAFSRDSKLAYMRNEEHCATCGGHLGHVFDDGPRKTTGMRHCINGVALEFVPAEN